ncbi:MAG: peptidoglycan DD-metalloendopeptidase family protein [Hymenobacteraceae bacterium]|nr:peptidoglycan DD-metalloendopeptidase family protein [Hymenobacteraceae bacterium]
MSESSKAAQAASDGHSGGWGRWLLLFVGLLLLTFSATAQRRPREREKPRQTTPVRARTSAKSPPKKRTKPSAKSATAVPPSRVRRRSIPDQAPARVSRSRARPDRPGRNRRVRRDPRVVAELAKSKAQLEREKRDNERRAAEANRILAQTRQRKQASLGQLTALQEKIQVQQGVIGTIASEVRYLDRDVHHTEEHVGALRLDLAALKQEYGRMIYAASKSANATDKLLFLFAAESFNQFAMRLRYLRQYADVRRRQAAEIGATQHTLRQQLVGLTQKRQTKQHLLGSEVAEKTSLIGLKTEQDQVVRQLSQQEEQLKREVAERQQAVARLDQLIAERVRAEIARAAREARLAAARRAAARQTTERRTNEATGETRPATHAEEASREEEIAAADEASEAGTRTGRLALTPDATRLSASFAGNRGRLPWPVSRGFVAERFGRHRHPVLKNVTVENHGVDIQTADGETARTVFAGKVLTVAQVPGMNTIVMIQHGEYFTVYAKLHDVRVRTGQQVDVREALGTVFTTPDGTTELQFQLWRNSQDLNPEAWLGRRR